MKLTAMRGDDAARVLCDLIEPASRILEDSKTADAFTALASLAERKMPPIAMTMAAVMALRPIVKAHGEDLFEIAAALIGKELAEVKKQPLLKTVQEVRAVWTEDIRDFFTSSAPSAPEE